MIQKHTDSEDLTDEFQEFHEVVVDKGQEAVRIDKFLMGRLEKVSRNRIQNAIKSGAILVNSNSVKANYKVRPLDIIRVIIVREQHGENLEPENIPLDIVYEDSSLLVLNKPAGLVVHPGISNPSGTLANGLVHYLSRDLPVMSGNPLNRPGLVHRIDKNTTGLMVIAKSEYALTHLAKQFYNHTVKRKYTALVWGNFEESEGMITGNIGRDPRDRTRMTVLEDEGKHAVTHFKVLEDYYYVSVVECQLETGRTHQIRVHMKHINHPLFGDKKYGGDQIMKGTVHNKYKQFVNNCLGLCQRHCLHARHLGFIHPETNEELTFESELPNDMKNVIDKWHHYYKYKKSII